MAETVKPKAFQLPADARARLTAMESDLEASKKAIEVLRKLGMNVSELDEKITWAEETRNVLLREF